jgi:serine/threonine protein kinase
MLGKLKGLFGSKRSNGAKPAAAVKPAAVAKPAAAVAKPKRRPRVNLQRRFTLLAMTAQGSMSRVHRAIDNSTGQTVCLKVQIIDKHAAVAARSFEARPDEGSIGMQINHPHVVKTFDYGDSAKGEHFIVMEFIDGVNLQLIRQARSADLAEKLELLAQAAEGLAALHAAGFIHHDIGPKNFLVDRNHQVKMIDLGLAVPNTPAFRRPGNRTGTVNYMAPELIRRESTDERLDVFSFGAMAFEFLTDRLPYDASQSNSMQMMLQRINQDPLDPAKADPTLPPELHDLLRKLTARRPEDRLRSMAPVAEMLRAIPVPESVSIKNRVKRDEWGRTDPF